MTRPRRCSSSSSVLVAMASTSIRMRSSGTRRSRPAGVSATCRLLRSNSFTPTATLELLNLHGQRRLRHMQLGRGPREAAGAREREKCPDMPNVVNHRASKFVIMYDNY